MKKLENVARVHTHTHTHTNSLKLIEINGNIENKAMCFSES